MSGHRQDRFHCDQVGDQEEANLEGVAAEDVAHGEAVIAQTNGADSRADLGQRGRYEQAPLRRR